MLNLSNLKIKETIPLKYHLLFWVSYYSFNVLRWGYFYNDYWYSIKSNLVEFPLHIVLVYINVYYLIPEIILKKKYYRYFFILFLLLVVVYVLRIGLNYTFVNEDIWPEHDKPVSFFEINLFITVVLGEIYVITFASAIKLLIDWIIANNKNEELSKLQLSTELKYLRTQIQPHFFFNALNNLYALTLNKSDSAPHLVIKLSDMMQYVLYEVNSSKTSLYKEINHLNNFIDIARLRFNESINVEIDITGNIEDIEVPPLLFLSLVENCFKHGLKQSDHIKIMMSFEIANKNYLEFKLSNTFNPETIDKNSTGIGLANTNRRLKLLYYNDYTLNTHVTDNIYNLFLKIPLR